MSSTIRPPLQTGTPTRLAVSPDQPPSVQEFLRSLKKSTRTLPTPKRLEAPQDNTITSCQLTVQGFLHSLRKPVTPPCQSAEAAEAPKLQPIASTGHEEFPFIDSAAKLPGPGFLDSPESILNEPDSKQVLSPSPEAKRLRSPNPKGADEKDVSMKIPKVIRTYAKKIKHVSPVWKDNPALFLTQSFTHEGAPLNGLVDDGSDAPTEQLASKKIPKIKPAKKHTSAVPRKRKRQHLQEDEEIHRENHSEDGADMVIREKKKKTKRKQRRAPVNELALVTKLPSHEVSPVKAQKAYDSDNAIDLLNEYLHEQGFPASSSPSGERSRKPMRANIGKPVTRIRQEITMPQREVLARDGFKFPPITPRAKKSPGWRLGSGFDGIRLEPSTNKKPQTSRPGKVRHTRAPCFLGRSLPKLELSTRLSPTRQSVGQRGISKRQKDQGGLVETRKYEVAKDLGTADGAVEDELPHSAAKTGENAAFEQVASLTALLRSPIENDQSRTVSSSHRGGIVKEPIRLHQKDLEASQAIREPSKSERNGWLKRRRVGFAVADEDEKEQLFVHTQRTSVHASEHVRGNGRNGLDTYFEDTVQAQHAVYDDLQAFKGGGQTTPNPDSPVTSRQQDVFQGKQSAEHHRHRASRDAEEQSSDSEEEILDHQSSNGSPEPPPSSDSESDVPTSPLHAKGLSMPKVRHHIEVPRTSEVPETQERLQESIGLGHIRIEPLDLDLDLDLYPYRIPATTLDSGKYFSKAVQQLDSPEKVPHTVTRRRSRREPDQDLRGSQVMFGTQKGAYHFNVAPFTGEQRSQKQEGSLELGVTPRLKRKMSNVPFRPPFKEPL